MNELSPPHCSDRPLAAHGVGTIDQAMLAGMYFKFCFLRLYGLDEKVFVIDEVHADMSAIIERLL